MITMVGKSEPAGPRDKAREWIAALLLGWVQSSGRAGLAAGAPLTAAQADDGTLRGCGAENDWSIDYSEGDDEAVITWANGKTERIPAPRDDVRLLSETAHPESRVGGDPLDARRPGPAR